MHRPDLAAGGPGRAIAHPWLKRLTRAFGASLLLLVLGGAGVAAAADIGHQDFPAAGKAITGTKPESKLWYHDGIWWASMWSTSPAGFYIYRLDTSTETWSRTNTTLDNRSGSRADTLWDGTHLYVASQNAKDDGGQTGSGSSHETRLYRYSYNTSSNTYTINPGYPVSIRPGIRSETLVIAKDSLGRLWATWTLHSGAGNLVYTCHTSAGDDTDWSNPVAVQFSAATTALDDISSIISFTVAGESRVGVFWSNQANDKDYFAWQPDGGSDTDWTLETPLSATSGSPKPADDHMNLKTDSSGKVYAVVKTSNSGGSQPLIQLLDRSTGGTWSVHDVGTVTQSNTRAIVELDTSASELHVFMTGRHNNTEGQEGGDIYEKVSPTSSISFDPTHAGTIVIRDDDSKEMNNVTSTKQNLNSSIGMVVLAYNDETLTYWHHTEDPTTQPVAPDANFTGSPTSGPGPLSVTFTNTSTGTGPLTYAWNFGDPGSGSSNTSTTKNPTHTYDDPGTYTVTLTATNDIGTNTQTRTGYITVLTPPDANFSGAPVSGTSPLAVTFTNTSTGSAPLTYAWSFGDPSSGSNTSTLQNPVHTYNPGTYTVTLTVTNAAGSDVLTRTSYITVSAPPGSRFHSITPTRVLDSRFNNGLNGVFHANAARTFTVADGTPIPTNAVAVTGNLTVTGQTKAGYVVLAPAAGGSTSTLNFPVGDTRANGVTVALGSGGTLNATYVAKAGATAHLIFDVTGYFR